MIILGYILSFVAGSLIGVGTMCMLQISKYERK